MSNCPKCGSTQFNTKQSGPNSKNSGKWFKSCSGKKPDGSWCNNFIGWAKGPADGCDGGFNQNNQPRQYVAADAFGNNGNNRYFDPIGNGIKRSFGTNGNDGRYHNPNDQDNDGARPNKRLKGESQSSPCLDNTEGDERYAKLSGLLTSINETVNNVRNTLLLWDEIFKMGALYAKDPTKYQELIAKRAGIAPSNNKDEETTEPILSDDDDGN